MKVLDYFIEINNWPLSRKVSQATSLASFSLLVALVVIHYFFADSPVVNLRPLENFLLVWLFVSLIFCVSGLVISKSGWNGSWIAYADVVVYSLFGATLIYMFGITVTPLMTTYTSFIVLWILFYGARVGVFGGVVFTLAIVVFGVLQSLHLLPFAPIVINRSIDSMNDMGWFFLIIVTLWLVFGPALLQAGISGAVRQRQEQKLREIGERLERSNNLIRRYVPSQLADRIIQGEMSSTSKPERARLTIFFSDLVGFTDISEQLEPEDLSFILNNYFSAMTAIAHKHGGTVDELSGDAILIFFGAPIATDDKDHALRAVRMALEMQQAVSELNGKWRKAGIEQVLYVRMGINTGIVTIGNFGSPDRMKYAALGKHVNLAARLQAKCGPGKILLSNATWLLVNEDVQCVPLGEMQFKGITKPVMTYELQSCRQRLA